METRLTGHGSRAALVILLLSWLWLGTAATALVRRQALVIGNSNYPDRPLSNPGNDADGVAVVLRDLDFDVVMAKDLDHDKMQRVIDEFQRALVDGSLVVFYFAGHGIQDKDTAKNYLIPISLSKDFKDQGITVDSVVDRLRASRSWANIVILDACRSPGSGRGGEAPDMARAGPRGFAAPGKPPAQTLVAYATAPNAEASDGIPGGNGVFTGALLQEFGKPGLDIYKILENTNGAVADATNNRQEPWFLSSLREPIFLRPESPRHCLNLLAQAPPSGGAGLGRVLWGSEILDPVLVRPEPAGYLFLSCSSGEPVEVLVEQAELFDSALVARFHRESLDAVPLYRHFGGVGYVPDGEADLTLKSAGHMLEARRLEGDYVAVVGSDSVGIVRDRQSILLVADRRAMEGMELETWDEPWGSRAGDSRIGREIIWWQLEDSGSLLLHQAVGSFAAVAGLVAKPAGTAARWESVLEKHSQAALSRAAYTLVIADTIEHVEALLAKAEAVNSATFDVAKLEIPDKDKRWEEEDLERLVEATEKRGRFWLLGRFFDLAAILPERIAGQVRFADLKSHGAAGDPEDHFLDEELILSAASAEFQIANAFYLDGIAGMARTASFLECLLEDNAYGASELSAILAQGLARIRPERERWTETTDVGTAFRWLFQGLDLPADLPVTDYLFESSVSRQAPELLGLVQSLRAALDRVSREDRSACDVVLIPDSTWRADGEPPEIVPAPSIFGGRPSPTSPAARRNEEALKAKRDVRLVLEDLIHVKGARHTRDRMMKGYRAFDRGNELLRRSGDEAALNEAVKSFEDARRIFLKAYEKAFIAEHSKTKVRVH